MVRKLVTGALVAVCGMIAIAPHTYAQDSINLEEVRKELQSARASANNNKVPPSQDSFTGDESDIQKRRASLLAAENALLDELQGSGPVGGSSPKGSTQGMIPPKSAVSAVPPSAPIAEREIPVLKENVLSVHKSEPVAEKIVPAVAPVIKSEKSSIREVAVVPSTLGDLEKIKSATSAIEGELSALRKSNAELVSQLKSTKSRSSSLQRDLEETRDRLMIAESEVERLVSRYDTDRNESLGSFGSISFWRDEPR